MLVKGGVQFVELRDAGDPVSGGLAKFYDEERRGRISLFRYFCFSHEGRKTMVHVVEEVASQLSDSFYGGRRKLMH